MNVSVFLPPWGETATPEDFEVLTASVEDLGYSALWIGDHVIFPLEVASTYPYNDEQRSPFDPHAPLFEPLGLLAYLAARTTRVRLGISVLVLPMRRPVETAKILAGIHGLSRERLILGVGAGWMREEFEALGSDYETRGSRTDEGITVLRHVWRGDETPFEGKFWSVPPLALSPKPASPIPIVIGGNSAAARRRALLRGDGWHALRLEPDVLSIHMTSMREQLGAAGKDPSAFLLITRDWLVPPQLASRGPDAVGESAAAEVDTRLNAYRTAGVDEFILEFPGLASTALRLEWLDWLSSAVLVAK